MVRRRRLRPPGRSGPRGVLTLLSLALSLSLAAGCTFERRADTENDEEGPDTAAATRLEILRDSLQATVGGFVEALRTGDHSRAVGMLHEEATLYDEESGHRWDPTQADSLLPGPMERDDAELRWELSESWAEIYDEAALVVLRYHATISREEAPWTAMETYVLVRADDGWRIRHLHRSRGPGSAS